MSLVIDRALVVPTACVWRRTPYVHQQRSKGVAVDCAGLIIGVARELGIVAPDFDVPAYGRQATATSLLDACDRWMQRVPRHLMKPGDVIAIAFDGAPPQHLGFLYQHRHGCLGMIHASDRNGSVVEHRLVFGRSLQFAAAWQLPGVV